MDNKNNKELIEVVKNNPDLPIIPATHYEVVAEDWGYWCGEIREVKVDYYYLAEEMWYAGVDEIRDQLQTEHENDQECELMSDEEFDIFIDNKFDELVESGKVKKAIIMYIGL
jgi:hypothetical protein